MAIFSLAQVLTIIHGRLLCDMGGVYQILNFMTDEDLFTHQLPRASRACEPSLKEQFPALATDAVRDSIVAMCDQLMLPLTAEDADARDAILCDWLAKAEGLYGSEFDVSPLGYLESNPKGPIEELGEMLSGRTVEVTIIQIEEA